jgi:hypothetical protein
MYITNDPKLAKYAVDSGVNRIFLDLEILGKYERQGHKDTLISNHQISDLGELRKVLPNANILVRINPFHDGTALEIEQVLQYNPQMIMLPMYKTTEEVVRVAAIINGRCELIPLLETGEALDCVEAVCAIPCVAELYVGLNDLHLSLKRKFMFELLADGTVEKISKIVKQSGKRFGFGGIARLGEGILDAKYILGEHVRLHSSSVILSRTFHRKSETIDELQNDMDFPNEIVKLKNYIEDAKLWSVEAQELNRTKVIEITNSIIEQI